MNEPQHSSNDKSGYSLLHVSLLIFLSVIVTFLLNNYTFDWFANYSKQIAVWAFGATLALTLIGFAVLAGWKTLIKKIGLTDRHGASDILMSFQEIFQYLPFSSKNPGPFRQLSKQLLAWYLWVQTWRTVIGISIALMVALAGFFGSALAVKQNELIENQNTLVGSQNSLLGTQNNLVKVQNEVLVLQLAASEKQVELLTAQNSIAEATRLAAFNGELTAILDRIDDEIKRLPPKPETADELKKLPEVNSLPDWGVRQTACWGKEPDGNGGYLARPCLSSNLAARIVSFSINLNSYTTLDGDTSDAAGAPAASVERAQLFRALALSEAALDTFAGSLDLRFADFRQQQLVRFDFLGYYLDHALFDGCDLIDTSFIGCDLSVASFRELFACEDVTFQESIVPNIDNISFVNEGKPMLAFQLLGALTDDPKWLERALDKGILGSKKVIAWESIGDDTSQPLVGLDYGDIALIENNSGRSGQNSPTTSKIESSVGTMYGKFRFVVADDYIPAPCSLPKSMPISDRTRRAFVESLVSQYSKSTLVYLHVRRPHPGAAPYPRD
ncbi:MAG: hypothetical protein Aurels2KO_57330 [Aureliella sp.]